MLWLLCAQYDQDVTTWSPQGRMHQVEYAMEAVKQGSAAVGLKVSGCHSAWRLSAWRFPPVAFTDRGALPHVLPIILPQMPISLKLVPFQSVLQAMAQPFGSSS